QVGRRLRLHLVEEPRAIPLDRAHADPERSGDLLRSLAIHEQRRDLAFTRRQAPGPLLDREPLSARLALAGVDVECLPDTRDERPRTHGFLDEVDRACG